MKFQSSYYTAEISRITGNEKRENIVVSTVLVDSYKNNKDIFQSVYTVQNSSISKIGLQYIQGYVAN